MYSTRNKAVAAFLIYNYGKEIFDHVEIFNGDSYLFFKGIGKDDKDLNDYYESFRTVTSIIKESKLYDTATSSKTGS